jgi:hypothetical protein
MALPRNLNLLPSATAMRISRPFKRLSAHNPPAKIIWAHLGSEFQSLLQRHEQINTHFAAAQAKGDISTLPARGHFYFALTDASDPCRGKVKSSAFGKVESSS